MDHYAALRRHAVSPGDLLVAGLGDEQNALGRACIAPDFVAPALVKADCFRARLRQDMLNPRYAMWYLCSDVGTWHIEQEARGATRSRATPSGIASIQIPLPPLDEQRRIVDFLDEQATLLDRAVWLRQRQLTLLDEREHAVSYATLLGLDGAGERRVVNSQWINDIPVSWSVEPLSRRYDIRLGKMLAPDRIEGAFLHRYLRNTNVQWDRIDTDDLLLMDFPPQERARYEVRPGDLLVCEGGEVGRAAIWNGPLDEVYYQKALHRVRPIADSGVRWLYYALRVATQLGVFEVESGSTTIAHLTGEQLREHRIPFPPPTTERRLVERLDAAGVEEARVRGLLQKQIVLLQERKQSLITAAVTGEFDVTTARSAA